jgi:hypothetical protein
MNSQWVTYESCSLGFVYTAGMGMQMGIQFVSDRAVLIWLYVNCWGGAQVK